MRGTPAGRRRLPPPGAKLSGARDTPPCQLHASFIASFLLMGRWGALLLLLALAAAPSPLSAAPQVQRVARTFPAGPAITPHATAWLVSPSFERHKVPGEIGKPNSSPRCRNHTPPGGLQPAGRGSAGEVLTVLLPPFPPPPLPLLPLVQPAC